MEKDLCDRLRRHAHDLVNEGTNASELRDDLLFAAAIMTAAPEPRAWQPLETAPRDGTEILLSDGHYKRTGFWASRVGVWSMDSAVQLAMPTQWMALPGQAAVAAHRCAGCGHRWDGELKGAELCGDCWRKVQPVLHGQ